MSGSLRIAVIASASLVLGGCGAIDPPVPHMHVLPSKTVQPGQSVTFDARPMPGDPPDNTDLTSAYKWDLDGDGSFEAFGNFVHKTYAQPGSYDVTLIESNTNGLYWVDGFETQTVVVNAPASGDTAGGGGGPPPNQPPGATFTYSPSNPCTECQTSFDASGSSDSDGQIVNYQWDWDNDGTWDTSGPGPTAMHAFDTPEAYTVRLRVTDDDGGATTTERRFEVNDGPPPGKVIAREWPLVSAAGAGTPFSLKLGSIKVKQGTRLLNGVKLVTTGITGRGKLSFTRLPKALKPHRTAKWAGTLSLTQKGNGMAARLAGQGYVLLRFSKRDSLCFAGKLTGDDTGKPFAGKLATAGGSGLGARVRGTGTFSLPVTGKAASTVKGRLKLRKTRKRLPLPKACRPLARTLR